VLRVGRGATIAEDQEFPAPAETRLEQFGRPVNVCDVGGLRY
jgi:hypothetical protein